MNSAGTTPTGRLLPTSKTCSTPSPPTLTSPATASGPSKPTSTTSASSQFPPTATTPSLPSTANPANGGRSTIPVSKPSSTLQKIWLPAPSSSAPMPTRCQAQQSPNTTSLHVLLSHRRSSSASSHGAAQQARCATPSNVTTQAQKSGSPSA